MKSQAIGLRVAGTLFGLMSLAQLARLIIQPQVVVAGRSFPVWPSALALVVLAALCFWMWKVSFAKAVMP